MKNKSIEKESIQSLCIMRKKNNCYHQLLFSSYSYTAEKRDSFVPYNNYLVLYAL